MRHSLAGGPDKFTKEREREGGRWGIREKDGVEVTIEAIVASSIFSEGKVQKREETVRLHIIVGR